LLNSPSTAEHVTDIFHSSSFEKFDCGKARVTFDDGSLKERYFFNSLGIDFDAAAAKQVFRILRLRRVPLYAAALVKTLADYHPHFLSVSSSEYNKKENYFLVCVRNGMWEVGGFKVTANALPDDGIFQVCCVREKSAPDVLPCLPYMLTGRHVTKKC
jgi:diacylglycerol kinase family enzyme